MLTHALDEVTDENFTQEVLLSEGPVLVDFWAEWCPPCHRLKPVLADLAAEWGDRVRVVTMDMDANPNAMRDYGVLAAPTMILFKGGEPVASLVGAFPKGRLRAHFEPSF